VSFGLPIRSAAIHFNLLLAPLSTLATSPPTPELAANIQEPNSGQISTAISGNGRLKNPTFEQLHEAASASQFHKTSFFISTDFNIF
jgi:hypothetical protein